MKPISANSSLSFVLPLVALALSICIPTRVHASPDIGFRFSGASYNAAASLRTLNPGLQPGFRLGAEIDIASYDVFTNTEGFKSHAPAFLADLGFQAFWLGASAPTSDGNLYRAWRGFSGSALAGVRLPAFALGILGGFGAFHLLGGGSLMSTKYTGTGLLAANPAIALRVGLDAHFGGNLAWGLELPIELAFKSGGIATIFGLAGSVIVETGKKNQ